jgi:hypothetical protein
MFGLTTLTLPRPCAIEHLSPHRQKRLSIVRLDEIMGRQRAVAETEAIVMTVAVGTDP